MLTQTFRHLWTTYNRQGGPDFDQKVSDSRLAFDLLPVNHNKIRVMSQVEDSSHGNAVYDCKQYDGKKKTPARGRAIAQQRVVMQKQNK